MAISCQNLAFLVILLSSFDLYKGVLQLKLHTSLARSSATPKHFFSPGTGLIERLWRRRRRGRRRRRRVAHLMSLTISFEVEWRIIAQNDPLD